MSLTKLPKELVDNLETTLDSKQNVSELGDAAFADILGTVSQSGGVPTGAIIERGSNSDGEYVKFADGTVWAWLPSSANATVTTPVVTTSGVSRSGGPGEYYLWTYPVSFTGAPSVTPGAYSTHFRGPVYATYIDSNNARIYGSTYNGSNQTITVGATAIGRWY